MATSLSLVQARLAEAVSQKPTASAPKLLAVSKTKPVEAITALIDEGQRLFAENRVQEAQSKFPDLKLEHPDLELHLIGSLQSKKAGDVVELFDCIHSVDRPKLAASLAKEMAKQDRWLPCFIQVNTGEEPQKAGVLPTDLAALYKECQNLGLNIVGLMCIPPADEEPAPHFAFLRKLAMDYDLTELSMGMSADFEQAAIMGATYVRVGSALFGERAPAPLESDKT